MKKLHLIMPMGGAGSRFTKEGFELPKPLLKINDKPFFYWATKSITKFIDVTDIIFVVLQEHIDKYQIDQEIKKYFPKSIIKVIPQVLNGAVLTCLAGCEAINDDYPIIFNDCDHLFKSTAFNDFINTDEKLDGALLTFESNSNKYSYAKLDENNNVIGTVEKEVVSSKAICGAYYFKNIKLFKKMANLYLEKCNYNEYFVSGVYNIMADNNLKIKCYNVDFHVPFGTPEEYQEASSSTYFEELD